MRNRLLWSLALATTAGGVLAGAAIAQRGGAPAAPAPQAAAAPKPPESAGRRPVPPEDAAAVAEFQKRLEAYVAVHKKAEGMLKPLPKEATPQQIDANQRALGELIVKLRPGARQGDIFTPGMQTIVKRLLARVFNGPQGKLLRASVMDENPVGTRITVNGRYPDDVPLSTMPPEVLQNLPELLEELEYRFVGDRLTLVDVHAHTIVDFVSNALPGA